MVSPPGLPVWVAALAGSAPSVACDFSYVVALAAFERGCDLGDVVEGYQRKSSLHTRSPRRRMSDLQWAPHEPSQVANNRHKALPGGAKLLFNTRWQGRVMIE